MTAVGSDASAVDRQLTGNVVPEENEKDGHAADTVELRNPLHEALKALGYSVLETGVKKIAE